MEERLGFHLPEAYKRFLVEVGSFSTKTDTEMENPSRFGRLFRRNVPVHGRERLLIATLSGEDSIVAIIEAERQARPPMPDHLVPFSVLTIRTGRLVTRTLTCFDFSRLREGEPLITKWHPWLHEDGKEYRRDQTFLDWLDREFPLPQEQEKTEFISPPDDWDDTAGWDDYWRRTIADDFHRNWEAAHYSHMAFREMDWLREQGVRRIVLAGNGISLEGHALAHIGFDVTVLDVSPAACEFVEHFPMEPRHLARFLPDYVRVYRKDWGGEINEYCEEKSLARVEREAQPGGRLSVITADMVTYVPEEPYDLVVSNRSIQAFSPERRPLLAKRRWEWVRPGGFCIVETMNLCYEGLHVPLEKEFEDTGFFQRTWEWETQQNPRDRKRRKPNPALAALGAEPAHLASGEKMVMFAHNSG